MSADTVFVGARIPKDLVAAIRERAERADRTFSAEVRVALREHLALDIARDVDRVVA